MKTKIHRVSKSTFIPDDSEFGFGGWLKDNALNITQTALGAGAMAIPGLQGVGAGLIGGGVGGMLTPKGDNTYEVGDMEMNRTVGLENNTPGTMAFAMGGDLVKLKGPKHDQGGIQLGKNTVEGDETIYDGVVNSNRLKITKELAKEYKLPKTSVGKTLSEYSKEIENKYKGKEGDTFSMNAKKLELGNLSKISELLRAEHDKGVRVNRGNSANGDTYAMGGTLEGEPKREDYRTHDEYVAALRQYVKRHNPNLTGQEKLTEQDLNKFMAKSNPLNKKPLSHNYNAPNKEPYRPPIVQNVRRNDPNIGIRAYPGEVALPINPIGGPAKERPYDPAIGPMGPFPFDPADESIAGTKGGIPKTSMPGSLKPSRGLRLAAPKPLRGITDIRTPQVLKSLKGRTDIPGAGVPDGLGLADSKKAELVNRGGASKDRDFSNLAGLAPIAMEGIMAGVSAFTKPEEVKLARVDADKVNPDLIDPRYELGTVDDTYDAAGRQIREGGASDYLRRRIQLATEEARSKSGVVGRTENANTQILNRAEEVNSANKLRADQTNASINLQEENINAANRASVKSARDFHLSNLATMLGQKSRDDAMMESQEEYRESYLDVLRDIYPDYTFDQDEGWQSRSNKGLPLITSDESRVSGVKIDPISGKPDYDIQLPSIGHISQDPLFKPETNPSLRSSMPIGGRGFVGNRRLTPLSTGAMFRDNVVNSYRKK